MTAWHSTSAVAGENEALSGSLGDQPSMAAQVKDQLQSTPVPSSMAMLWAVKNLWFGDDRDMTELAYLVWPHLLTRPQGTMALTHTFHLALDLVAEGSKDWSLVKLPFCMCSGQALGNSSAGMFKSAQMFGGLVENRLQRHQLHGSRAL
jgi:hypothetical protein